MKRRRFVQQLAGVSGALTAGIPLTARATTAGTQPQDVAELPGWFDRLDTQGSVASAYAAPPELTEWLSARGLPGDLFQQAWELLGETAAFRDLPPAAQEDARVQERLRARLEQAGKVALDLRNLLVAFTSEDWRAAGDLARDPERLEHARQVFLADGQTADIDGLRAEQMNALFNEVSWSFANLDAEEVGGSYIQRVDEVEREAEHVLKQTEPSRAACRDAMARVDGVVWGSRQGDLNEATEEADRACVKPDGEQRRIRYMTRGGRTGLRFMLIGSVIFGVGVLSIPSRADVFVVTGVVSATVGGLLLGAGLVMFLVGAMVRPRKPAYVP